MSSNPAVRFRDIGARLLIIAVLSGCQYTARDFVEVPENQFKTRGAQSRAFATTDREKMLRSIIATLQDVGFIVDHADHALGSVGGTKLDHYALKMTVTVLPRGRPSCSFEPVPDTM